MLSVLLLVFAIIGTSAASTIDVDTIHGVIRGSAISAEGRQLWHFLGIPFAEPPGGPLRFLPPQPVAVRWDEPFIADTAPKGCLQIPIPFIQWPAEIAPRYSEDCLYLNVWTPSVTGKRSVLVWIHGGGFVLGEGYPMYDGRMLSALGDVVVVVIQYRLNILGFARLDDEFVPGNVGLLDQQVALAWVKRNIAAFGGDPNSITIGGESAGAGSVSLHMLSPGSEDLFQRGIMMSGATPAAWSVNPNVDAVQRFNRFAAARYFNCDKEKHLELFSCMQNLTEAQLLTGLQKYEEAHPSGPHFGPTVDGRFLPASPQELMAEGKIQAKDAIIGVTEQEGALFVKMIESAWLTMNNLTGEDQHYSPEFVRFAVKSYVPYFPLYPQLTSPAALELITLRSISHTDPTSNALNFHRLSERLSEFFFVCSCNEFADTLRKVHPNVYYYELARKTNMTMIPMKAPWMKTSHGDDIPFLFLPQLVHAFIKEGLNHEEMLLARRIIGDFAAFVKTGAPRDPNWRRFSLERKELYRYDIASSLQYGGKNRDGCAFWDKALPMVNGLQCQNADGKCALKISVESKAPPRDEL